MSCGRHLHQEEWECQLLGPGECPVRGKDAWEPAIVSSTQEIARRAGLSITVERPIRPGVRGGGWECLAAKVVNYDCDRPWIVQAVTEDGDSGWLSIGKDAAAAAGFTAVAR